MSEWDSDNCIDVGIGLIIAMYDLPDWVNRRRVTVSASESRTFEHQVRTNFVLTHTVLSKLPEWNDRRCLPVLSLSRAVDVTAEFEVEGQPASMLSRAEERDLVTAGLIGLRMSDERSAFTQPHHREAFRYWMHSPPGNDMPDEIRSSRDPGWAALADQWHRMRLSVVLLDTTRSAIRRNHRALRPTVTVNYSSPIEDHIEHQTTGVSDKALAGPDPEAPTRGFSKKSRDRYQATALAATSVHQSQINPGEVRKRWDDSVFRIRRSDVADVRDYSFEFTSPPGTYIHRAVLHYAEPNDAAELTIASVIDIDPHFDRVRFDMPVELDGTPMRADAIATIVLRPMTRGTTRAGAYLAATISVAAVALLLTVAWPQAVGWVWPRNLAADYDPDPSSMATLLALAPTFLITLVVRSPESIITREVITAFRARLSVQAAALYVIALTIALGGSSQVRGFVQLVCCLLAIGSGVITVRVYNYSRTSMDKSKRGCADVPDYQVPPSLNPEIRPVESKSAL